jgi:hypothetical protein
VPAGPVHGEARPPSTRAFDGCRDVGDTVDVSASAPRFLVNVLPVLLVCLGVLACSPVDAAEARMKPTLAALETLGFRCGDGSRDNEPSGLVQWSCGGRLDEHASTVLLDASDEGVVALTLFVDGSGDATTVRADFARIVDVVPPLDTAPILKSVIADWSGGQHEWTVGGVRLRGECAGGTCILAITSAGDPLRPLPRP